MRMSSHATDLYSVYAKSSAFPLVRHTFTGTPFLYKNIYGNIVPTRFGTTTHMLGIHYSLLLLAAENKITFHSIRFCVP